MSYNLKPNVGISCGDPNGIALEVILKSLKESMILDLITPIVFCDFDIISYQNDFFKTKLDLEVINKNQPPKPNKINVFHIDEHDFKTEFGKSTFKAGSIALSSLERTVDALRNGWADFIVSNIFNTDSLMFMISDKLKVGLLTDHVPLTRVVDNLSFQKIFDKIKIMHFSLKNDFSIKDPRIALLSVNPHAGDDGVIGGDDLKILIPAVKKISDLGFKVSGPYPADSYFGSGLFNQYNATMAVYHDQGLIPFKTISFGKGINYTAGLGKIRTSPDHGTAYNIAGKNIANHLSLKNSILCGLQIFKNRTRN